METSSSTGIDYGIHENKQEHRRSIVHSVPRNGYFLSLLGYAFRDTSLRYDYLF